MLEFIVINILCVNYVNLFVDIARVRPCTSVGQYRICLVALICIIYTAKCCH